MPLAAELLCDELDSDASACETVEIVQEVSRGFYKASAIPANGNDLRTAIRRQGDDKIPVQIPTDQ